MDNVFTKLPEKGDIIVKNKTTKVPSFVTLESFNLSTFDTTTYEICGVVVKRKGKKVLWMYKSHTSLKWCSECWWYLTGFTLDGTSRTGKLNIRAASNSWASNISYTFTYQANLSDTATLISQLNTQFKNSTSFSDFNTLNWRADLVTVDGVEKVRLHCNHLDYRLYLNTATDGFSFESAYNTPTSTYTFMPGINYVAKMLRKNGNTGGAGAISCWAKALDYFTADLDSTTYNPSSVLTYNRQYPICLPGYLGPYDATTNPKGTTKRDTDYCTAVRAVFGEGETGWVNFMRACLPVVPTDYGNMGLENGKERTELLASFTYTNDSSVVTPMCNAASYCYNISTDTIDVGEMWLPTTEEISYLLETVLYGKTGVSIYDDPINWALYKIGGTGLSYSSYLWSCCRYYTNDAWNANGDGGFFYSYYMYGAFRAVPVSLYEITE